MACHHLIKFCLCPAAFPLTSAYSECVVVSSSSSTPSIAHFFALPVPCIYGMHCIMVCYNFACCFVGIELGCYLYRGPLILSSRSCSRCVLNSFLCPLICVIVPSNAFSSCNLVCLCECSHEHKLMLAPKSWCSHKSAASRYSLTMGFFRFFPVPRLHLLQRQAAPRPVLILRQGLQRRALVSGWGKEICDGWRVYGIA